MDKQFIVKMLKKHIEHLKNVEKSIQTLIEGQGGYDFQIRSLSKLQNNEKYGWRVKELENKRSEAFIKLSNICPNIEKMEEQIKILEDESI